MNTKNLIAQAIAWFENCYGDLYIFDYKEKVIQPNQTTDPAIEMRYHIMRKDNQLVGAEIDLIRKYIKASPLMLDAQLVSHINELFGKL